MWNDLPADVVTASTVRPFGNQLEAHLKIFLDGRQSNRNSTHRSSVFICVFLGYLYTCVKTGPGIRPTALITYIHTRVQLKVLVQALTIVSAS